MSLFSRFMEEGQNGNEAQRQEEQAKLELFATPQIRKAIRYGEREIPPIKIDGKEIKIIRRVARSVSAFRTGACLELPSYIEFNFHDLIVHIARSLQEKNELDVQIDAIALVALLELTERDCGDYRLNPTIRWADPFPEAVTVVNLLSQLEVMMIDKLQYELYIAS